MNLMLAKEQIKQFLLEDMGTGDLTSESIFPEDTIGRATVVAKGAGVVAGIDCIGLVYSVLDQTVNVELFKRDGDEVAEGEPIAVLTGPMGTLLTGERLMLNLLQRMSGIATMTRQAVTLLGKSRTKLCATRKTTPGLRLFEKYAITCGGGYPHRYGLYDGVMFKDNHIAFCGSIREAVERAREKTGHMVKIEVEIETEEQLREAIEAKADIIMFDNRTPEEIRSWLPLVPDRIITEASGGITLESLPDYRDCGVDYISLGFLTHSVKALDISLQIDEGGMLR